MPNIRQFGLTPQQSELHPSEEGPSAFERVGRTEQYAGEMAGRAWSQAIHEAGNAVGFGMQQYEQHVTTQDILKGFQDQTALNAKATEELPQVMANSDDPVKAMQDYYENTYLPAQQKIVEGMSTDQSKRWAAEHTGLASQQFFTSHMAQAMNIQGAKAIGAVNQSVDNLAVAAHSDPHGLAGYLEQANHAMDGIKSQLTPQQQVQFEEHRQKVVAQITMSAGHALADQNPQQFQADLASGKFDTSGLSVEQQQALRTYAHVAENEQRSKARNDSMDRMNEIESHMYDPTTGRIARITPQLMGQIDADPTLRPQDRSVLVARMSRAYKEQLDVDRGLPASKNSPTAVSMLTAHLGDQYNPLTQEQIDDAAKRGLINSQTAASLSWAVKQWGSSDPKDRESVQYEKGADTVLKALTKVNNPFAPPSADNAAKYEQARIALQDYVRTQRGRGMTDADIFKEGGKAYWLTPGFAKTYGLNVTAGPTNPLEQAKHLIEGEGSAAPAAAAPPQPTQSGLDIARKILGAP